MERYLILLFPVTEWYIVTNFLFVFGGLLRIDLIKILLLFFHLHSLKTKNVNRYCPEPGNVHDAVTLSYRI